MATLIDIQRRIVGVRNTSKITQAMKMVSAAKLRRAQDAIIAARPYVDKMEHVLAHLISSAGEDYSNPVIEKRKDVNSIAMIVIGTDRGLCGSFNANLFRTVGNYIDKDLKKQYPKAILSVIPVGRRSVSFFKKTKYNILNEFPGIFAELKFSVATDIISVLKHGFVNHDYDRVYVYYNAFVNVIKQEPKLLPILPIDPQVSDAAAESSANINYIYEPGQKEILDVLLPKLIDIQLWRSLLESNAAEQAARMIAMDNATNNARDLIKALELKYNKERQAAITKEMLEIVSGAESLRA